MTHMWNDFSWNYLKRNRTASISVIAAAFISALLLTLLCSLFYNFRHYEIERLKREEGSWHCRIQGEIQAGDIAKLQNYANVKEAVWNEELRTVDIEMKKPQTIFRDISRMLSLLEQEPKEVYFHDSLLSMYLVRSPQDDAPRLVFPLVLAITVLACISLIMIIHNAFAISMNDRIRQFGILSSVGAAPRQIRICLLQEAAALCALPAAAGTAFGLGVSRGIIAIINHIAKDVPGREEAVWTIHPLILILSLLLTAATVLISAWIPAAKISRITPLEAIKNTRELHLTRSPRFCGLSVLFGIEGELAQNAWKAQKKALRTASLAMTVSFLAFSLMQCFFTLTRISQRMTYFERYQDAWDIMVTVNDTDIAPIVHLFAENRSRDSGGMDASHSERAHPKMLSGVRSCVIYQKAMAKCRISEEDLSREFLAAGGFANAPENSVSAMNGGWAVNAPIVVLDDAGFIEYCEQAGITPQLNGAVLFNRINCSNSPNFRISNYLPYLNEERQTTVLYPKGAEENAAEIPVLSCAATLPVLKEAYDELDRYVLVHILPFSLWKEVRSWIGGAEEDTYIRILAREGVTLPELTEMEGELALLFQDRYTVEINNRIQDKINNDDMIDGMMLILGGFCVLLAIIGIANVFSNTLGFVRQRRREIARYLSIGMPPEGIRKMFCIEALLIVGRPVLATLILTGIAVALMLNMAYLEPMVFLREMPVLPIAAFILTVFAFVGAAYFWGGKKVMRGSLAEALRDDTVM